MNGTRGRGGDNSLLRAPSIGGDSIKITFSYERDTKRMYRFAERVSDQGEPMVGSLYIKKSAFPDGHPAAVVVTIEPVKA